jgi:hypothetical protein
MQSSFSKRTGIRFTLGPVFIGRMALYYYTMRRADKTTALLVMVILAPLFPPRTRAEPLVSPTWAFRIDPPEGYRYSGGDGKNRFSFQSPNGAALDLVVYPTEYASVEALAADVQRRLESRGTIGYFEYGHRPAAMLELVFSGNAGNFSGWGICLELAAGDESALLCALAYGPAGRDLGSFHLSALDSIAREEIRFFPGPVTEYRCPRGRLVRKALAGIPEEALIGEGDAEAAQALVDREFAVLQGYLDSPLWKEAWIRFYRAIYRDSFDRLAHAAFVLERRLSAQGFFTDAPSKADPEAGVPDPREFAGKLLAWVQGFRYERNFMGSDFVNPISAAFEGRGDCDSRALLWAIVLARANIPAAMMVSRDYGHAMGLADLPGSGAHFEVEGKKWLVAETTAPVAIGLIGETVSDIAHWLGIIFE